jgi:hypothetical protein
MTAIDFIAKYLHAQPSRILAFRNEQVCAFTGERINKGVRLSQVLSSNFTGYDAIPYDSQYVSVNTAKCFLPCLPNADGAIKRQLRQANLLVTEQDEEQLQWRSVSVELTRAHYSAGLHQIQRSDILDVLRMPPRGRFVLSVAESYKKLHWLNAAVNNPGDDVLRIGTDAGQLQLSRRWLTSEAFMAARMLYSKPPGQKYPFFSKQDILTGELPPNKAQRFIQQFDFQTFRYYISCIQFELYKPQFQFLVYLLNPTELDNND